MATYWVRTKISLIALLFCLAVSTQAETINCITWECPTTSFSAADTSVSLDCEDEQIQIQNHGQTTNYDISPYVGNQIFGVSIKEGDSSEISVNNSMEYVSVWKMNDRGQWNLIGVIDTDGALQSVAANQAVVSAPAVEHGPAETASDGMVLSPAVRNVGDAPARDVIVESDERNNCVLLPD